MGTNVEKVEIFKSLKDDQWYWRGVAANGETVASGEAHTRVEDAERAATGVFPEIEQQRVDE